ncbi:MAG TPA: hypothetical protein ENN39_04270 [Desulfonatronum sp.]|nr:hypothetical protein [Desulfonatronum sp.]
MEVKSKYWDKPKYWNAGMLGYWNAVIKHDADMLSPVKSAPLAFGISRGKNAGRIENSKMVVAMDVKIVCGIDQYPPLCTYQRAFDAGKLDRGFVLIFLTICPKAALPGGRRQTLAVSGR